MKSFTIFLILTSILFGCEQKRTNDIALINTERNYKLELVVSGLSNPWGMTWLPDGRMLITEKKGDLILFDKGKKINIQNVPEVYDHGQGGLLDIELHPRYQENGWIYMTLASKLGEGDGGHTSLLRCKLEGTTLTNIEYLYKASPNTTKGQHFGSRIEFDDLEYVYFSIGERGERDSNPQDITKDGGKIYRLFADGRVPPDNPFIKDIGTKSAIYTYGHRNPQGMAKHPKTGDIWIHEHGPKGGDEVNIIKKGANYGWPIVSYGVNYNGTKFTDKTTRFDIEPPIYYWVPSIAPCGMAFVNATIYPNWKESLLVGSLKFNYVELLKLNGNKVIAREKIAEDIGRVRNVKLDPFGYIYIAVEGRGIMKVIPN